MTGVNNTEVLLMEGVFFIWLFILTIWFIKINRHYKKLVNISPGSLQQVLEKILNQLDIDAEQIKLIEKKYQELAGEQRQAISHFSLVRFNPFDEVGGKQSFTIALLDKNNTGIVLTAFHNRDATRIYAKKIEEGKTPESGLSEEEKLAIKQALGR